MKTRRISESQVVTIVLMALAVILLVVGTVGGSRAALTYSETYSTELSMQDIGVVFNENDNPVENGGVLLKDLLGTDEAFKIGKEYEEVLTVKNTGSIDQYVRVTLYKYWQDDDGKRVDLSPAYIKLALGTDNWIVDPAASTAERTVLYYKLPLKQNDETSAVLTAVSVDNEVLKLVEQSKKTEGAYTTVTNTYKYDSVTLGLKAEVDVVQAHNGEDAILSAWGATVSIADDGTLSLG
ncbi:MAG: hypothetical protein IKE27_05450 [Oscillospiraceae bacterium]|nr:hypothetical protein [Oscillospiraceae bacterium]